MRDIPGAQSFAVFAIAIMRMRTGTETGPIDVSPIAKVVLRLVSGTSPIANLIPFEAGFGEHRVGDFVFVRFVVIVRSRQRARRDLSSHFRIRRDGERICGNMVDAQIDGGADGCAPIVKALPRRAVDQIELERMPAALAAAIPAATFSGVCVRSSVASTCGTADCMPKEIRLKPPSASSFT